MTSHHRQTRWHVDARLVAAMLAAIDLLGCAASDGAVSPANDASARDAIVLADRATAISDSVAPMQSEISTDSSTIHAPDDSNVDAVVVRTDVSISANIQETGTPDATADGDTSDRAAAAPYRDAATGDPTPLVLAAQGDDCFPCAQRNGCLDPAMQGGTCEDTTGEAPSSCAALFGLASVTEARICLATLSAIFTSKCAATLQGETPCLCGDADPASCLAGAATPAGPALPLYACDFDLPGIATTTTNFTNQAFGAGQANALVQCLASWSCDCFGSQ